MADHSLVDAATRALAARPTCPHVVMVTIAQSARCDACTATVVAESVLRAFADSLPTTAVERIAWVTAHHGSWVGLGLAGVLADVRNDLRATADEIEQGTGGANV